MTPYFIFLVPFHSFNSASHLPLLSPPFFSSFCHLMTHTYTHMHTHPQTCPHTHVIQCQAGIKGDELCCLSLSLMAPVSFPLSGHSHRLVRAKVMFDSFSHTSSGIDWACLAQSNRGNLLIVAAFILTWRWKGNEWPNGAGVRMEREGGVQTHLISKQMNE